MRNITLTAMTLLALCGATTPYADAAPARTIPTVTRAVQLFSTLESDLHEAVRQRDKAGIDKVVGDDFELRSAATPGRPTARAQWLEQALAAAPFDSSIEQMAVHEYGEVALVSFLWKIDANKKSALPQQVFVVDTWRQVDGAWKVVTRYAAPRDGAAKKVPGVDTTAAPAEKKI